MIHMILKADDNYSLQKAAQLLSTQVINRPVIITMQEESTKRSGEQNKLQWAGMLGDFENQAILYGRTFSAQVWHEYLKEKFLPDTFIPGKTLKDYKKWIEMPDGRIKIIGSTTKLTPSGFSDYLEQCYAFGCELGVKFTCR